MIHVKYLVRDLVIDIENIGCRRFSLVYFDADKCKGNDNCYDNIVLRRFDKEEPGYAYVNHMKVKSFKRCDLKF